MYIYCVSPDYNFHIYYSAFTFCLSPVEINIFVKKYLLYLKIKSYNSRKCSSLSRVHDRERKREEEEREKEEIEREYNLFMVNNTSITDDISVIYLWSCSITSIPVVLYFSSLQFSFFIISKIFLTLSFRRFQENYRASKSTIAFVISCRV